MCHDVQSCSACVNGRQVRLLGTFTCKHIWGKAADPCRSFRPPKHIWFRPNVDFGERTHRVSEDPHGSERQRSANDSLCKGKLVDLAAGTFVSAPARPFAYLSAPNDR
jgi:hypothetical protein